MKIAVIGAGRMGALRTEDLVKVGADVTVFNRNLEGAKALSNKFNCHHDDLANLKANVFDGYAQWTVFSNGVSSPNRCPTPSPNLPSPVPPSTAPSTAPTVAPYTAPTPSPVVPTDWNQLTGALVQISQQKGNVWTP
jgi:hypothetical protein